MFKVVFNAKEITSWLGNNKYRDNAKKTFLKSSGSYLKDELIKRSQKVSGELRAGYSYKISTNKVEALGYEWADVVLEYGRKGGSMPPISALKNWSRMVLGNEKLAYVVAKRIKERGTKSYRSGGDKKITKLITDYINNDKDFNKFLESYLK